jgi:hypothetical protein
MSKKLQLTSAINDKPFNAHTARYPMMGFRKVDGVRAGHLHGFFHGRSLDPFKNIALNAKFNGSEYRGLDGELTINGLLTDETLEGETLCSLTTGLTNRSKLQPGEDRLPDNAVWNLFDLLDLDTLHLPYLKRYEALQRLVKVQQLKDVTVLPFVWIENAEQAELWIAECLELGYEGAIFRDPNAMHKSGRATSKLNDFWRYKPVSDKDAYVIEVYEAMENRNEATTNSRGQTERSTSKEGLVPKGVAGGFIARDAETGKTIRVPVGKMKAAERKEVWENREAYVHRPFKYQSLDTGVKDQPRQGRWICWRAEADMEKAA